MKLHRWLGGLLVIVSLLQTTACSDLVSGLMPGDEAEATPSPTPVYPDGLPTQSKSSVHLMSSTACQINSWYTIGTEENQGDLMDWSPDGSRLAWIRRQSANAWLVGDLVVASGENFQEVQEIAKGINTWGDLAWSPQGTQLAFVALRKDDLLYTVMTVSLETTQVTDLFPDNLAQTDSYTSPKAVDHWVDENNLLVSFRCDIDCTGESQVNISVGYQNSQDTLAVAGQADYLEATTGLTNNPPLEEAEIFSTLANVNASPNQALVAYIDLNEDLWIFRNDNGTIFPIELDEDVVETKWSPENDLLAIRTDNQVLLYQVPCQ